MQRQQATSSGEGLERSCRGAGHASTPGQVVVLYPDEAHDGRAGTAAGSGYRIAYVAPAVLADAVRTVRGRAHPLPFVGAPVSANGTLARGLDAALFRVMFGTSPHRYLLMRRLELARERIHRQRPLAEVAADTGFADQAHFTRTFRSAFGLTPAGYRALRAWRRSCPGGIAVSLDGPPRIVLGS